MTTPDAPQPRPQLDYFDLVRQLQSGGVPAVIRTVVPFVVGAILAWVTTTWGIVVPEDLSGQLETWLTVGFGSVYYVVVRWAEQRWPGVGRWLLGLGARQQPVYTEPEVAAEVTQASPPATAVRPEVS